MFLGNQTHINKIVFIARLKLESSWSNVYRHTLTLANNSHILCIWLLGS